MIRCGACECGARYARPTGPLPSQYALYGEKPGRTEAFTGKVFQGKTGLELDSTYLPLGGLERDEVYISNVVKCWLGEGNDQPTDAQVAACASAHVPREMELCQPEVLILMGATACKLIPKLEVEKDHGLPIWVRSTDSEYLGGWEGWCWPMFHPAAGLHNTSLMIPLLEDWKHLGMWREGKWNWNPRPYAPTTPYKEILTADDFEESLEDDGSEWGQDWVATDTENDGPRFWSAQYSFHPGSGYFIAAGNMKYVHELHRRYKDRAWWIHNALHDLQVYESVGVKIGQWRDTMVDAFHMGNLPQGLKALVWRLTGRKMRSWEDVAGPPSRLKMTEWLSSAWLSLSEDREKVEKRYVRPRAATPDELRAPAGLILGHEMTDLPMAIGRKKKDGEVRMFKAPRKCTPEEYGEEGLVYDGEPRGTREVVGRVEWKVKAPEAACKRILSHSHKPTYEIWEKAEEAGLIGGGELAERIRVEVGGGNPIMSIANADRAEAVWYASEDADQTAQLGMELDKLIEAQMKEWDGRIGREDWDK